MGDRYVIAQTGRFTFTITYHQGWYTQWTASRPFRWWAERYVARDIRKRERKQAREQRWQESTVVIKMED